MPTPGDVDIVIASELMEAGRAIARGLVTPDRTTLIASSHRIFAIAEKSAMGDGAFSPARVLEACHASSRELVLADLQMLSERNGSVISASLFGALAGSGALPFLRDAFEGAIIRGGLGVDSSLRAFAASYGLSGETIAVHDAEPKASVSHGVGLSALQRMVTERLPESVRATAILGIERLTDYQDAAYAGDYLHRVIGVHEAEQQLSQSPGDWPLTRETARYLALWMSYEDAIRVADLKTRERRSARVLEESRATPDKVVQITEFMHPRFEELCDMLPAWIGRRLIDSDRAKAFIAPLLERDRTVRTTGIFGFLLLYAIARLRSFRRGTYRFAQEHERIEAWLASALNAARGDLALATEIIRCQRLVKGYGDTHARGLHNFAAIMRVLPLLASSADGAQTVRTLREAALKDDEGHALAQAMARLDIGNARDRLPLGGSLPIADGMIG